MDDETRMLLHEQQKKLDAIYKSVEATRKYFLGFLLLSVAMVVVPLIGLAVVLPKLMSTMTTAYEGLL